MEAELTGTSGRRGGGSGGNYGERRRRSRSAIARDGEGDEGERGEECREVLGGSVALGWGRGGSRRWKQEVAAGARAGDTPLPTGRGG